MSIKRFMLTGGNAALENGSLTSDGIVEVTEAPVAAVTSIDEEIVEITEILDPAAVEVEEKLEELEEHNEAMSDTEQLEDKIDELTALVDDEEQDIEYVTARVDGALEVATEMFTARYGLSFASTKDKLMVARENHTGSVDSRRQQLRASLEDAKEKSGGFKNWIGGVIDKILKWFADMYHKHLTAIGTASKKVEGVLKKIEANKEEFGGAGEVIEASALISKTFGFIDKEVTVNTIRDARKNYSVVLNETPNVFKAIEEAAKSGDITIDYKGPLTQFTQEKPGVSGIFTMEGVPHIFISTDKPTGITVKLPNRKESIGVLKGALSVLEESRKFSDAMKRVGEELKKNVGAEEGGVSADGKVWAEAVRKAYTHSAKAAVRVSADYIRATAIIVSTSMKTKPTPEAAPETAAKIEDKSSKK